jgi:ketosteroid isomerase-like protein
MASGNLELVRSIFSASEGGDYSATDWAHPEIQFVVADEPTPGTWTGVTSLAEAFRGFLSPWEEYRVKAEPYRELDDERVLVFTRRRERGKSSGLELGRMRSRGAVLFHFCSYKVRRHVRYLDSENALPDVCIEE